MALSINEVAARLNLPIETVHRWVRQGKIPMQRQGDSYVIRREMLERWADEHKLEIQDRSSHKRSKGDEQPEFDSVLKAVQRGGVYYDVEGADRESALRSAVQHIPNIATDARSLLFNKLLERELLASTGIGHGIALPHPRSHLEVAIASPQITTCFLDRAVPYDAIDGQPVRVLMVLLSRSTQQHLVMLSKLSFFLRDPDFRQRLSTKPSRSEIFDKIAELESKRE
jgi:PTS system nitrogen regulatory IIA component